MAAFFSGGPCGKTELGYLGRQQHSPTGRPLLRLTRETIETGDFCVLEIYEPVSESNQRKAEWIWGTSMKASDPHRTAYVRILKEELRADQTVCVLAGKGLPAQRGERPAKSRSV